MKHLSGYTLNLHIGTNQRTNQRLSCDNQLPVRWLCRFWPCFLALEAIFGWEMRVQDNREM